jgi:RNA polymerase sigma-70 factor (ECF subfamily)
MDEAETMTMMMSSQDGLDAVSPSSSGYDWAGRLSRPGLIRDEAIGHLHALMLRAARSQVSRLTESSQLGSTQRDEIVHAAADEATVSVLTRLATFEGRSRFTTWAYKFGILHAGVEVRRAAWRPREIDLYSVPEPVSDVISPEDFAEANSLGAALLRGIAQSLTAHQRRVAVALLIDDVPIDVLAERLGSNRNAIYKTLHDARKRLREDLIAQGFLCAPEPKEANS